MKGPLLDVGLVRLNLRTLVNPDYYAVYCNVGRGVESVFALVSAVKVYLEGVDPSEA